MARSLLTLAAAVTAAVPGADVVGVRQLTSDSGGRYDSVVVTLGDGSELVARVPTDEESARELAAEVVALRSLTDGARALLSFAAPRVVAQTPLGEDTVFVSTFLPGYQVDAPDVPPGAGLAPALGAAIAEVHALPPSVVRQAGLPHKTASESRASIERLFERAIETGRVPVRLMTRWREAIDDDALWAFETTVSLGGTQAASFLVSDSIDQMPRVSGLVDWHNLAIDDPAADLRWISSAPDAADDVLGAYSAAANRAPDEGLIVRARLHAELEFARWLVHGVDTHQASVVDDAAVLLASLAEGTLSDRLIGPRAQADVDDALGVIKQVPTSHDSAASAHPDTRTQPDTSIHTDTYDPRTFDLLQAPRDTMLPPRLPEGADAHTDQVPVTSPVAPPGRSGDAACDDTAALDMREVIRAERDEGHAS